jgi:hypothetical protein
VLDVYIYIYIYMGYACIWIKQLQFKNHVDVEEIIRVGQRAGGAEHTQSKDVRYLTLFTLFLSPCHILIEDP